MKTAPVVCSDLSLRFNLYEPPCLCYYMQMQVCLRPALLPPDRLTHLSILLHTILDMQLSHKVEQP